MRKFLMLLAPMALMTVAVWIAIISNTTQASAPTAEWTQVLLIDKPKVELDGAWFTTEQYELGPVEPIIPGSNTGGLKQKVIRKISDNAFSINRADIAAALALGVPTTITPPTGCTIMLRWSAATQDAWWKTDETLLNDTGCHCHYIAQTKVARTLEEVRAGERRDRHVSTDAEWVKYDETTREMLSFVEAGHGRVEVFRDEKITIGTRFWEDDSKFAILAAVKPNGDTYFWVVEKP